MRRFACALVLLGCASPQTIPVAERTTVAAGFEGDRVDLNHSREFHTREFAAPANLVFEALLDAHEELKIPLQSAYPSTGVALFYLQANRLRIADQRASTYFDCGAGPAGQRADSYRITLQINAFVEALPDSRSRLRTEITASAREPGQSSQEVRCHTTGALEARILAAVARHVES
jgi:hypothetical protein